MIRVGHFSDLHYSAKRLEEADRCFDFAVEAAIERGIDVAVISGDATDHALEMHNPAVERLAHRVVTLADHCPVLMLQGTFSHEPPGTLATFALLRGRCPIKVVQRICQLALQEDGTWRESEGWRFQAIPAGARAVFTCVPTVNKANVAAVVGATEAALAQGQELSALLAGYAGVNAAARQAGLPTIGVSHGTVSGCLTEHGVPMAGFDHEFTSGALFSAGAQAFLLGHIHRHQVLEDCGRLVAYAGSIGRFHHGELGDKGFLLWEVNSNSALCELVPTPARRTLDLFFEGVPDQDRIEQAAKAQGAAGAHVRVRWSVANEDRHQVDREAIRHALRDAASVQLEGRVVPVGRTRSAGISRCTSLAAKVSTWCKGAGVADASLLGCLEQLTCGEPVDIAQCLLAAAPHAQLAECHTGAGLVESP
jgi:exonuclease SbcD